MSFLQTCWHFDRNKHAPTRSTERYYTKREWCTKRGIKPQTHTETCCVRLRFKFTVLHTSWTVISAIYIFKKKKKLEQKKHRGSGNCVSPTIEAYQISHQSLTRMSFSKVITHKRICIGTMNYHQTTTPAPTCKPACVPKHNGGPLLNGDLGNLIEMDHSESTTGTDKHCRLLNQC